MGDILKEAIADAKAVRETALQNAKMALEEAFTPQLKSMLSAKLKEDEFDDEEEVEEFGHDDEEGGEEEVPAEEGSYHEDEDEFGGEAEVPGEEEFGGEEEPDVEEEGIIEVNGIKYAPISEDEGEEEHEDEEEVDESNLDLEAVIKELESELSEQDDAYDENAEEKPEVYSEQDDAYDESKSADRSGLAEDAEDEEVEIDESMFTEDEDEDDEDDSVEESNDVSSGIGTGDNKQPATNANDDSTEDPGNSTDVYTELKEYKEAVRFLKDKLHEVNILNAKLLFTNKLFREFVLDNSAKMKVVENFDRAQTVREIKLVYATLAEGFKDNSNVKRKSIKESASQKSGSTKPNKKVITEEASVASRFKKLAGLI